MSSAKHTARHSGFHGSAPDLSAGSIARPDSPAENGAAFPSGRSGYESGYDGGEFSSGADQAVESLHRIDEKVNALRAAREADPDSLLDKAFKAAVPALVGMVAGKAFQTLWDKGTSRRNLRKGLAEDAPQGLLMSLAFAAASAAFGAVVSQLSDRGSKAIVARRHRKARR
ncbi:hypothetical protein DF196_06305 [Bifidobacterium callitrichidarum]|uniref:DUF4235 domain-containing protein n=1 Tax=Bifidobacterium callitrichidarum TaxID=2052941 RepID=A0A2U2N9T7_9BIFI|nr:hypothetical protein DF196_06305 [Bifidobacterium callitrichidarum]